MNDRSDDALYSLTLEQLQELYETPEVLAERGDLTVAAKRDILRRWKAAAEHAAHHGHKHEPGFITMIGRILASPFGDEHLGDELDEAAGAQDF